MATFTVWVKLSGNTKALGLRLDDIQHGVRRGKNKAVGRCQNEILNMSTTDSEDPEMTFRILFILATNK